ncbi:hypothetical protein [Streptomyces carpinensis]|uniref:Uncharacterized protein n=1 Tax=Streptomyces carpinensis TaxID=66369 RepID=A0ABV1WL85_9ACTN|nr:hypothetical protein [Streptomyces carpinensis]
MSKEFWRTIQTAIEKDNWTARLVVIFFTTGAAATGTCGVIAAR